MHRSLLPLHRALFLSALMGSLASLTGVSAWAQSTPAAHAFFRVQLAQDAPAPLDGRVLLFLKAGSGDQEVDNTLFNPKEKVFVAAQEVHHLPPGGSVEIDADQIVAPGPYSSLPTGDYEVQAVLDPAHTYNYSGRTPGDWVSAVVPLKQWSAASPEASITLDHHPSLNPQRTAAITDARKHVQPGVIEEVLFVSPMLTRFSGNPATIKAWVILPPGYAEHPGERYPTVFSTPGFGGTHESNLVSGARLRDRMDSGKMPPMFWVMLDESCPEGTHEFADSVNNGPWGAALTTEFIPMLEAKYRMDAKPTGRFLNGHSSGGWATLQLQINYPNVFGGTWSTSPDPSDFHDFTGVDLYAPHANLFRKADGSAYPLMRMDGRVVATLKSFSDAETVLGPYGGQLASFEWVFSPRSPSGAPMPMYDRVTGDVHPRVVAYWHDHYDLAYVTEQHWARNGAMLKGRIHVWVGTADTFYLDGSAHLFEARLKALGADPHFTYLPDRSHFDVYVVGTDRQGLFDQISAEMYAIARPGQTGKK